LSTKHIDPNIPLLTSMLLAMDIYILYAHRGTLKKFRYKKIMEAAYYVFAAFSYLGYFFLVSNFNNNPLQADWIRNLFIGFFWAFIVFKLILVLFFLVEDTWRVLAVGFKAVRKIVSGPGHRVGFSSRRGFIRQSGLFVASIPFTSMLYGITKGKYDFRVRQIPLTLSNLPRAFDGFRIAQISDIHSGSFDDIEAIRHGVALINQQKPDIILFTGDLVNFDAREIEPFIGEFKKLNSKIGVYSVLGNHDYGDYKKWDREEEKLENRDLLRQYHKEMNFNLLMNENVILEKEGERISIVGVENWGKVPFPQNGDIDKAVAGAEDVPFKILMSHDPYHWSQKVISHPTHFDLTLAGHTHGMQFGVDIPGFKWSPAEYVYPQWAGLYEDSGQLLYVNRGFGFIGFPGRVGIAPEITVFELRSGKDAYDLV